MTLVRKVDGAWLRWNGAGAFTIMATTGTLQLANGTAVEVQVPPYPIEVQLASHKVEQLLASGAWGDAELDAHGLKVPVPFVAPAGKQPVGPARYAEDGDQVLEEFDVEDIPQPDPAPTPEQKLASAGLTTEELDHLIAASLARQGAE